MSYSTIFYTFLWQFFYVKKIMFLAPKIVIFFYDHFPPADPEVVFATVLLRFTTRKIYK